MADSWQPIETAPKDGSEFWALFEDGSEATVRWFTSVDRALYDGGEERGDDCWLNCDTGQEYVCPTHWRSA